MNSKLLGILGVWVVAGTVLSAADFWEERDFTTWTEEDIVKMLADSPWAKEVGVRTGKLTASTTAKDAAEAGNDQATLHKAQAGAVNTENDYGQGPGGLRSNIGDGRLTRGAGRQANALALNIAWRSALPFKQAVVRKALAEEGIGGDARIPAEQQQFLDQAEDYYVVSISGFPARSGAWFREDALMASTSLVRKNARPLFPENIEVFLYNGSLSMLIYFSKDDPITLADKDVEFISTVVDIEIKKKFKLKDMVFGGELVL